MSDGEDLVSFLGPSDSASTSSGSQKNSVVSDPSKRSILGSAGYVTLMPQLEHANEDLGSLTSEEAYSIGLATGTPSAMGAAGTASRRSISGTSGMDVSVNGDAVDPDSSLLNLMETRQTDMSGVRVEWSGVPGQALNTRRDDTGTSVSSPTLSISSANGPTSSKMKGVLNTAHLLCMLVLATAAPPYGIETVVKASSPRLAFIGLFLSNFLFVSPQALICAELSSMIPTNHGSIAWVYRSMGSGPGFYFALNDLLYKIFDMNAYLLLVCAYTGHAFEDGLLFEDSEKVFFALLAGLMAAFNVRIVGNSTLVIVVCVLIPLLIALVMIIDRGMLNPSDWVRSRRARGPDQSEDIDWPLYVSTLIWINSGWDITSSVIGEIGFSPRKISAVFGATFFFNAMMHCLALLICLAVVFRSQGNKHEIDDGDEWRNGFVVLAFKHIEPWLGPMAFVGAFFVTFGSFLVSLISISRVMWAMTESAAPASASRPDVSAPGIGVLPSWLGTIWDRTNSPVMAVFILTVLNLIISLTVTFERVVKLTAFFCLIPNIMKFTAFIMLRYVEPSEPRPFRVSLKIEGCMSDDSNIPAWLFYLLILLVFGTLFVVSLIEEPWIALLCACFNLAISPAYLFTVTPDPEVRMPDSNKQRSGLVYGSGMTSEEEDETLLRNQDMVEHSADERDESERIERLVHDAISSTLTARNR